MLCSNIETGIGCICSSLPSLRHFLQRDASSTDSKGLGSRPGLNSKTISQQRPRKMGRSEEDWEELQDGDSDRSVALLHTKGGGIQKEQTFALDIELRDVEKHGDSAATPASRF
jgi:hypothetical protein